MDADLLTRVAPLRVKTISTQHSDFLPMFGIGLLLPNERGTAQPDVTTLQRPWPEFAAQQRVGMRWQRFKRPCPPPEQQADRPCPWRLLTSPALARALRASINGRSFTAPELDALLEDASSDGQPVRQVHAEHYVEEGGLLYRPEAKTSSLKNSGEMALAALWHELCLTPNVSTVHGLLYPVERYRHPLCAVASPGELGIFLGAAERKVKRGYLMYASRQWYCGQNRTSSPPAERPHHASGGSAGCAAMPRWAPTGPLPTGWLGAGPLVEWHPAKVPRP